MSRIRWRNAPVYGGVSYYSLIGAAHIGSPVMPGDARIGPGNNIRGVRLLQADCGVQQRVVELEQATIYGDFEHGISGEDSAERDADPGEPPG